MPESKSGALDQLGESPINITMIYFVLIDQDVDYFVDTVHKEQMLNACNQQIKFFKELRQYSTFDFNFLWANNHQIHGKGKQFYKTLVNTELKGIGSFNEVTTENLQTIINNPTAVYLLGGNVNGCMINRNLPFNYYSLSQFGIKPKIVLDLCYDYTLPYSSDRELYSTLAYICKQNSLDFIDAFSLKKNLLSSKFTS